MAEIYLNRARRTLRAVLTKPEFAIVEKVLPAQGTRALQTLFASFLQQAGSEQRIRDQEKIRTFAEQATDDERAKILAVMP
jgi:hypothetical protein